MNRIWVRKSLVVVAVLCLMAGSLWASNMGFMLNCTLIAATTGISLSGTNTLNLPYQHTDLANSGNLMTDIGFSAVTSVSKFLEATDSLQTYTGNKASPPPFPITSGECYFVKMRTTTDYVIEGSHIPGLALSLDAAGIGNLSGTNFISLPYHSCARTAKQLMDDIGFSSVAHVARFIRAVDALQVYTGRKGSGPAFDISPCECYFVKMTNSLSYIPSHY